MQTFWDFEATEKKLSKSPILQQQKEVFLQKKKNHVTLVDFFNQTILSFGLCQKDSERTVLLPTFESFVKNPSFVRVVTVFLKRSILFQREKKCS